MSSISSLTSTAPLSKPASSAARPSSDQAVPANTGDPDASTFLSPDAAEGLSGQAALARVATTPLWSATFELPKQPELPTSSKQPWEWVPTPGNPVSDAGGTPSLPQASASWGASWTAAGSSAKVVEAEVEAEPDAEMTLFDMITWPIRTITGGVVTGVNAVVDTWQNVGRAVGEGAKSLVGAVGNVASDAWKAITSIRFW